MSMFYSPLLGFLSIVPVGSNCVLAVYFWYVVYSHYKEVKNETSEPVSQITNISTVTYSVVLILMPK